MSNRPLDEERISQRPRESGSGHIELGNRLPCDEIDHLHGAAGTLAAPRVGRHEAGRRGKIGVPPSAIDDLDFGRDVVDPIARLEDIEPVVAVGRHHAPVRLIEREEVLNEQSRRTGLDLDARRAGLGQHGLAAGSLGNDRRHDEERPGAMRRKRECTAFGNRALRQREEDAELFGAERDAGR